MGLTRSPDRRRDAGRPTATPDCTDALDVAPDAEHDIDADDRLPISLCREASRIPGLSAEGRLPADAGTARAMGFEDVGIGEDGIGIGRATSVGRAAVGIRPVRPATEARRHKRYHHSSSSQGTSNPGSTQAENVPSDEEAS